VNRRNSVTDDASHPKPYSLCWVDPDPIAVRSGCLAKDGLEKFRLIGGCYARQR
jgi:hypothetical protein